MESKPEMTELEKNKRATKMAQDETSIDDVTRVHKSPEVKTMTPTAWAVYEIVTQKPRAKQQEIADAVGITRPYVSRIVNSSIFQLEMRKWRNSRLLAAVENSATDAAERMGIIAKHSEDESTAIEATKVLFEAVGMRNNQGRGGVNVNINAPQENNNPFGVTGNMVQEAQRRRQEKLINPVAEVVNEQEK